MGRFEELFDDDTDAVNDFRSDRKKRVGAYVLGRTLGEGSFAKVRLAVHLVSREKVAVKVVNKRVVMKREYARRNLHREAAMLQRLDHPNIIKLYEVMETDNHYYIVTELADGYDFMGYISERYSLPEEESRTYMRQIVSAVDHMHRSGVVHRDLKIENLMLDKDMNVKIIDFGLGNAWDGHNLLTTQCGSPAYAAPEIFSKKPYGPAVDLWSIGVNLYAMLTGSLPFTADPPNNLTKLHAAILKGCTPPSNVSKECQSVLVGLMDTDEKKRMTMAQLRDHPWIKHPSDGVPLPEARLKSRPQPSDLDEAVIEHMVRQLGMDEHQVREALLGNKVNALSATYHLLHKRKRRGGGDGEGGLGPGMPREFLTQKWSPPNQLSQMGSLRHAEPPPSTADRMGPHPPPPPPPPSSTRPVSSDKERILHRQQMNPAHIGKSAVGSRQRMESRSSMSQYGGGSGGSSRTNLDPPRGSTATVVPTSAARARSSAAMAAVDPKPTSATAAAAAAAEVAVGRTGRTREPTFLAKGRSIESNYKDCLNKLRSQRDRPSRGILRAGEGGRPVPMKAVAPAAAAAGPDMSGLAEALLEAGVSMADQQEHQPLLMQQQQQQTAAPPAGGGSEASSVGGYDRDSLHEMSSRRSTSASTKSVRFNLDADGEPGSASSSALVAVRAQSHSPAHMERLVLRRLSADRGRRENVLSMAKIRYHRDHWEINQDAIDTLRQRSSPDNSSVVSFSSGAGAGSVGSGGRMRAMRVLRRAAEPGRQQQPPPPPPPNSALGRHSGVPILNSQTATRHPSSAGPSNSVYRSGAGATLLSKTAALSGTSSSNHGKAPFSSSSGVRAAHGTPEETHALATSHLLPRSRQVELLEGAGQQYHHHHQTDNCRLNLNTETNARVLVWDLKLLDSAVGEGGSPEPNPRVGSAAGDSPTQLRKLGTLRGQVKPKPTDFNDLKQVKGLYKLPDDRTALTLTPRGQGSAIGGSASSVSGKASTTQALKVRLKTRGAALCSVKDPYVVAMEGPKYESAKF